MSRHLIKLRVSILFSSDGAQGQISYIQGKWRPLQCHKERAAKNEHHCSHRALSVAVGGRQDRLLCLTLCGESNRQRCGLARGWPASQTYHSGSSNWMGVWDDGFSLWMLFSLQSGFRWVQSLHALVLIPHKIHLRSSKISTLDRNKYVKPIYHSNLLWSQYFTGPGLGAVSQLGHCFVDLIIHVHCKEGYLAASLDSTLKIPEPWHTEKSPKIVRCLENQGIPI